MASDYESGDESAETVAWRSLSILPCSVELEKSDPQKATNLYESFVQRYPQSYKLWHAYLRHLVKLAEGKALTDPQYEFTNNCFERSLVFLHKMPRIWIEYCTFLTQQLLITKTRRTFDRALKSLPVTQHSRIWPLYIEFIKQDFIPIETGIRVYKRYKRFLPDDTEDFIDYLTIHNQMDAAAYLLCDIINRPKFVSKRNKTKYELWEELCDMICDYGDSIQTIDVDAILRDAINKYPDQQGKLYNTLASYYTRLGLFTKARDVYEEAMNTVATKKDFAEIWDAYSKSEEEYIKHLLSEDYELDENELLELEIRQTAYENLVERRELLSSSVALRQNPHNVREWLRRVDLYNNLYNFDPDIDDYRNEEFQKLVKYKLETFSEAVSTVVARQAVGNYEDLWICYALFYENIGDTISAKKIFEQAIKAKFSNVDQLANVWCHYIEFELKQNLLAGIKVSGSQTMILIQRSVSHPTRDERTQDYISSVQSRLPKCLKLWLLYADLEENFGSFEATKAVYNRILDLKIATPQVVLNFAKFLEESQYYEQAFRVYERGVALFQWPNVYSIWSTYLVRHVRFLSKTKKLDRLRDLFEQCLKDCPPKYSKEIYLLYAKIELNHGLLSRATDIYYRATKHVDKSQRASVYRIFIRSMMKFVDVNNIRKFYESAIAELDNKDARNFSLEYAKIETELQELERARTIYSHCSQMCDPKVDIEFWDSWKDFETQYGDIDTISEMLRIKRSTQILLGDHIQSNMIS